MDTTGSIPGAVPSQAAELLPGNTLPIVLVTIEQGQIIDVRIAARAFVLAQLAGAALVNEGDKGCQRDAGRSHSHSA